MQNIDFNCQSSGYHETRHFTEVGCLHKAKCIGRFQYSACAMYSYSWRKTQITEIVLDFLKI